MTIRNILVGFFLLYGLLIPIMATAFMEANLVATLAIIGSCVVISTLLWIRKAVFFNILISFYVFKVYLTRPYVDIFLPRLTSDQAQYINSNNYFFNASDAKVVYLSLLSLLIAWLLGLLAAKSIPVNTQRRRIYIRIFHKVDEILKNINWRTLFVWILLIVLNHRSGSETWQGIATGESVPLFAFGVFSLETIGVIAFLSFLSLRHYRVNRASLVLLVPILYSVVSGVMGGSRAALFVIVVYALVYLTYLNYDKFISVKFFLKKLIFLMALMPIVIFSGMIAQLIRPLLLNNASTETVNAIILQNIDILNFTNLLNNTFYFGLTELLHRVSALKAQFLILNDHYINTPWETYNPIHSLMRVINDLVPGDIFDNTLSINQLFEYIYLNTYITYNSEMWSIQGTFYLYFGFVLSSIVVFFIAYLIGRHSLRFAYFFHTSPAFTGFTLLLFNAVITNGTIERIIPVHIVRPFISLLFFIFIIRILYILFPRKLKITR